MSNFIFFKTTADFNNTGEVLIYKSLLQYLRLYGHVIVNDGESIQALFLDRIGIRYNEKLSSHTNQSFISYIFFSGFLSLFNQRKIWLVTGVGEHSLKGWKCVIKNLLSFLYLLALRLVGVRVLRVGMSIRFAGKKEALSERLLSCVVNHYYVRDSLSYGMCRDADITKCKLAPDLSWGLKMNKEEYSKEYVIFSFRDFCENENEEGAYKSLLKEKIAFLCRYVITNLGNKVIFTYQCDSDRTFMKEISNELHDIGAEFIDQLVTLENAAKYYGKARYVISNRLHVLLLSYKLGAPGLCVTDLKKHAKIRGIFLDNGLENALIDIHLDNSEMITKLKMYDCNCEAINSDYNNKEKLNMEVLNGLFDNVFQDKLK